MDDGFLQGDPEYLFEATLVTNSTETMDSTNELSVAQSSVPSVCPSYAWDGLK